MISLIFAVLSILCLLLGLLWVFDFKIKFTNTFKNFPDYKAIYYFPIISNFKAKGEYENRNKWTFAVGWLFWLVLIYKEK
jgi:hypothetical protein